jgi:hypothetical protein
MAQEQEKEPAQLSHIGLDLQEGVVSLFGTRRDGLVRFRFFLPPGLQQLLSTDSRLHSSIARLVDAGDGSPTPESPSPAAAESQRSTAFFQSAPVDGTLGWST